MKTENIPTSAPYIPAPSSRRLTPLHDPLLKWGMREEMLKRRLMQLADPQPDERVRDLGCGTGTPTLMLKQAAPLTEVTAVDGEPEILSIAPNKALQAHVNIKWDQGIAYELPYPDNSFEVVVCGLVIRHLITRDNLCAFKEVRRSCSPEAASTSLTLVRHLMF